MKRASISIAAIICVFAFSRGAWADPWPARVFSSYNSPQNHSAFFNSSTRGYFKFYYHHDACNGAMSVPAGMRIPNAANGLYSVPRGSQTESTRAAQGWKKINLADSHKMLRRWYNAQGYPQLNYFIPAQSAVCGAANTEITMSIDGYSVTGRTGDQELCADREGAEMAGTEIPMDNDVRYGICGVLRPFPYADENAPARNPSQPAACNDPNGNCSDPKAWCLRDFWTVSTNIECLGDSPTPQRTTAGTPGPCSCAHGGPDSLCYNDDPNIMRFYIVRCNGRPQGNGADFDRTSCRRRWGWGSCLDGEHAACCSGNYNSAPAPDGNGSLGSWCRRELLRMHNRNAPDWSCR